MARAGTRPLRGAFIWRGAIVLLIALVGCAGNHQIPPMQDEALMSWSREAIKNGHAGDAVLELREFLTNHPGSRYVEEARVLLGRSLYEDGNDAEAEVEFEGVLRDFPGGEFAPEARYYLALSLLSQSRGPQLDQSETHRALSEFQIFLGTYPNSPLVDRARTHIKEIRNKLAHKEYLNGHLYLQRGNQTAARYYFEHKVLDDFGDTEWAPEAMLGLAQSYRKTKDWKNAAAWGCKLRNQYPASDEARKVQEILDEAAKSGFNCGDQPTKESPPAAAIPDGRN